jgi:hypothetical protein
MQLKIVFFSCKKSKSAGEKGLQLEVQPIFPKKFYKKLLKPFSSLHIFGFEVKF